ncbi:hypothetical protein [uncultured Marivita sp.]|uniref:hypothetical protein n=1 Tax=uncultured Marivita sp. TaxID=888080 RepID=UPI002607CA59|nr:hypothetical protein [uncultured Marivita sp.]
MAAGLEISPLRALRMLWLGASLFAANMATATEGGFITIVLADERLELPLNAGHSDWTGSAGFAKVSILTRPTDLETWQRFQSLRLAFDLLRNGAQLPEMSLLRRSRGSGFERWYGRADSGGLAVVVTDRALDGDLLQVSGSFTGTLGQSFDFGQTIDLSTPMPVSGTFEVRLLPIR